jgi:hypothetical protein
MNELTLLVRTADLTRKAEVRLPHSQTGAELIQEAVSNWKMSGASSYTLVNVSKSPAQTLDQSIPLVSAGVTSGETLEIQPVLVAGSGS